MTKRERIVAGEFCQNQALVRQIDFVLVAAAVVSLIYVAVLIVAGEPQPGETERQLAETRADQVWH